MRDDPRTDAPPPDRFAFRLADRVLDDDRAVYWKTVVSRSFKVGIEIEVINPPGTDRDEMKETLSRRLEPSRDNRRLGNTGVLNVSREIAGLEIKVIGRLPIFQHFIGHIRTIYGHLEQTGCLPDGRCGMHEHLLAVHLGEDMPSLILANLWNLTRWYAPALRFITSCGPSRDELTRRSGYCDHAELMALDAARMDMMEIKSVTEKSERVREHNNFLNIERVAFAGPELVKAFHFEYRFPDMDMTRIGTVAKAYLPCAFILRAVELSKYGVIDPDPEELARRARLLSRLSNDRGRDSMSDTSELTDDDLAALRDQARAMVRSLKPIWTFFDPKVHRALSLLAMTPVSMLRHHGNGWSDIESILASTTYRGGSEDPLRDRVVTMLELMEIHGCDTPREWMRRAGRALDVSSLYVGNLLGDMGHSREVRWDSDLGAMIFHYR
jgi:hypothetical protein